LEDVRPYLRSQGGNVELLEIREGVVRLRLEGSCDGCPSSAATMRQTIEEAIVGKAPDVTAIEVEGGLDERPVTANGGARLALPVLRG
jgi:Fe-S cluster biogenesis protein NfuA